MQFAPYFVHNYTKIKSKTGNSKTPSPVLLCNLSIHRFDDLL